MAGAHGHVDVALDLNGLRGASDEFDDAAQAGFDVELGEDFEANLVFEVDVIDFPIVLE